MWWNGLTPGERHLWDQSTLETVPIPVLTTPVYISACLANRCLPELRAGIAYDVIFVKPFACFHADKVDNKIGGWENACLVTFDRKILSGGNSTQKDRPKNLTHHVNLIELTYI